MVAICYASDIIEFDRGTSHLSDEPLHMKKGTNS